MPDPDVEKDIRNLIAEILEEDDPQKIYGNAKFVQELGMDSMMALEIFAGIEKSTALLSPKIPYPNLPALTGQQRSLQICLRKAKIIRQFYSLKVHKRGNICCRDIHNS